MKSGVRNTLLGLLALIAVVLGLFFYSFLSHHTLSDAQYQKLGYFPFHPARQIGHFSLVDQDGRKVGHDELLGHWTLLYFGYTNCPDVCPTTLATLARAMKQLTVKPTVVMVSVDPERDTPAKLKRYLSAFDPDFLGYTGTFDGVVGLAQQVNIAFGKVPGPTPGTYEVDHSANIVVVNTEGQYAGFIRPGPKADNVARVLASLMHAPLRHD